jgi:hypothetical protein
VWLLAPEKAGQLTIIGDVGEAGLIESDQAESLVSSNKIQLRSIDKMIQLKFSHTD